MDSRRPVAAGIIAAALLVAVPHDGRADPVADAFAAFQHGDFAKAYKLCLPWAQQGDADAEFLIGLMYANGDGVRQDVKAAAEWYGAAADDGQDVAQNNLGRMYAAGSGVRKSYAEAARLYWLSADQGNPRGQFNLAKAYRDGQGVDQSNVHAYMWYTLSMAARWDSEVHDKASKERDALTARMKPAEIAQAQAAAAAWQPSANPSEPPWLHH